MTKIVTVNGKPIILGGKKEEDTSKSPLLLPENTATTTGVIDTDYQDITEIIKQNRKNDVLFVPTPIFMLFAEFLGYTSMLINMAEDWCNPQKGLPSKSLQRLLEREAKTIYDEMLEEYSEKEIHELYNSFYTCGLDELEDDLNGKISEADSDGLPF